MAVTKRNKSVARFAVVLGTLVAGIGIWAAVNQVPVSASSGVSAITQSAPVASTSFTTSDTFLNQPPFQTQPVQSAPVQSARLRTRGS